MRTRLAPSLAKVAVRCWIRSTVRPRRLHGSPSPPDPERWGVRPEPQPAVLLPFLQRHITSDGYYDRGIVPRAQRRFQTCRKIRRKLSIQRQPVQFRLHGGRSDSRGIGSRINNAEYRETALAGRERVFFDDLVLQRFSFGRSPCAESDEQAVDGRLFQQVEGSQLVPPGDRLAETRICGEGLVIKATGSLERASIPTRRNPAGWIGCAPGC